MKQMRKWTAIIVIGLMAICYKPAKSAAQGEEVSFQVFYDALSPYGSWTEDPTYGYVWIPNVGAGFSPYASNGYWANADEGWTWVSDFDWGWAPFHYGRWDHNKVYGWYWVPDYTWGPAWVAWTYGPGYYGWAPIAPGIGIDVVLGGGWHPHNRRWCFVPEGHMGDRNIGGYYRPRTENVNIIANCTIIRESHVDNVRHVTYVSGPRREDVARITHRDIPKMVITDRAKPGHGVRGNQINVYRPQIVKKEGVRPGKIEDVHNVTPVKQRNADDYRKTQPVHQHDQIIKTQPYSQRVQQPQQQPQQPRPQQQQPRPQQQQPRPQPQQQQPRPQQQQPRPQQQQQPRPQQQQQPRPQMQQPRQQSAPQGGGGRHR